MQSLVHLTNRVHVLMYDHQLIMFREELQRSYIYRNKLTLHANHVLGESHVKAAEM